MSGGRVIFEFFSNFITLVFIDMAVIYDIKTYRIPNNLNLVGSICGLVLSVAAYGVKGLLYSFTGILIPIVLLFVFYCFGIIGAGDIKLLAMIGSFMFQDILYVIMLALILTSIFGVFVSMKNIFCIATKKKKVFELSFKKIHLSIPIALGAMLFMIFSA